MSARSVRIIEAKSEVSNLQHSIKTEEGKHLPGVAPERTQDLIHELYKALHKAQARLAALTGKVEP